MIHTTGTEFRSVVKGKNLMTPTVSGYYISGNYICEISRGTGFNGEPIYGVTVVNGGTMQHDSNLSKMVYSLAQAKAYVKELGTKE